MVDKLQSNAKIRAEELAQDIRPYISIYTPENVIKIGGMQGQLVVDFI